MKKEHKGSGNQYSVHFVYLVGFLSPLFWAKVAIFLISEDLDELFKLSNKLLVIYEGKVIKSFSTSESDIESIGLAMAGISE